MYNGSGHGEQTIAINGLGRTSRERDVVKYRADIDGLRAVAVLAVVSFHARLDILEGGYIGVDVFFVISGYLITSLIVQEIQDGRFSIVMFYERRIRRIFPALFTVMFATALVGAVVLLPDDFDNLGRSMIAATVFASNILFWRQSNYFDTPAEKNPLIHTWSLAVEEQFYILFPLFLLFVSRLIGGRWLTFLIPIVIVSFALSSWGVLNAPTATFYLAPTRAWELLVGSVLALRTIPPISNVIVREVEAVVGLVLLGWGIFTFGPQTAFPGPNALIPCLATTLLIHAGMSDDAPAINRFLGWRPIVFVGLISYSLYLWHWPALVLARQQVVRDLTESETAAVLILAFVAAVLSWRFVEQPFRGRRGILARRPLFLGAAATVIVTVFLGAIGPLTAGWPARWNNYAPLSVAGREFYREGTCFLRQEQTFRDWHAEGCFISTDQSSNMLWWGDSFAAHYVPGIEANTQMLPQNVLQYTAWGCAPVFGYDPKFRPNCGEFNEHAADIIERFNIDTVVLAARWWLAIEHGLSLDQLGQTIERLQDYDVNVIVIGQSPEFFATMNVIHNRTNHTQRAPIDLDRALTRQLISQTDGATFVDPLSFLCDQDTCQFRAESDFLFWDEGHLSVVGADRLIRNFLPLFNSAVADD